MKLKYQAVAACVFTCAFAGAGSAQAQFFDLQVKTSHSAYAAGMPVFYPTTIATQPNGQPTFYAGAPATIYSLSGTNAAGEPTNGVSLGVTPLATFLAQNPNLRVIPAAAERSAEVTVKIDNVAGVGGSVTEIGDIGLYRNACENLLDFNTRNGFPAGTTVQPCDAVDATLRLNGVSFKLTGAENRTELRLAIPEVGFDFIAPSDRRRRVDALESIDQAFFASGKAPVVTARLLGKPDSFELPKGVLPDEGTAITGSLTVGGVTKSFGVASPAQLLAYAIANRHSTYSDFGITYADSCFRNAGGVVTGSCQAASATLSIVGIQVNATSAANSPDVTFTAPDLDLAFTSSNSADRDDALGQFLDYANDNADRGKITAAYARYLAQNTPNDPLVGNPYSAQGQLVRGALDLDNPSQALAENNGSKSAQAGGRAPDTSGWMVGGRAGYLSAGGSDASFIDGVFERGFRVKEGSRARLKLSVPVSYTDYGGRNGGGRTATFGLRSTLEMPLIDGRWVLEPTASAAAFYSSNEVSSGALYLVGVSSRYKLAPVGRGHIVIGNAITYSSSLHIEAGDFATPKIANTTLRNGIAYQVPYGRFLGRQGTVRASYTYTHLLGDKVFVDSYHDVSLSYGVASREASVRQFGETLRIGVSGSFGHDFTAASLTAGYRF